MKAASKQIEVFIEAAKSLECDESEERFDETLKKVAQHKPVNSDECLVDPKKEKLPPK